MFIGGINEEQYFLLVPSNLKNGKWKYLKFANWLPGEEEYESLESYFKEVLSFLNETIESGKNTCALVFATREMYLSPL